MRQIFFFIALAVLGVGLYLKFFYDVPDNQETINFLVSWFFIIVGISGMLINLFWRSSKRKNTDKE
jgi:RsiW-degrading membrane proteinase PrsW (M82 family)